MTLDKITKKKFIEDLTAHPVIFLGVLRGENDSLILNALLSVKEIESLRPQIRKGTKKSNHILFTLADGTTSRLDLAQQGDYTYYTSQTQVGTFYIQRHKVVSDMGSCMVTTVQNMVYILA